MDAIIRDEYIKLYGERPNKKGARLLRWVEGQIAFRNGWMFSLSWHERQNMMSKDYQERVQEEARLAEGR